MARVDAGSGVTASQRTKLWLDTHKIHVFDPTDGHSMTRASDNVGVA